MVTAHELALAASINLANALMGFAPCENIALALGVLNEIAGESHAAS